MVQIVIVIAVAFVLSVVAAVCGAWSVAKLRRDVERGEQAIKIGYLELDRDNDEAKLAIRRAEAEWRTAVVEQLAPMIEQLAPQLGPVMAKLGEAVIEKITGGMVGQAQHAEVLEAGRMMAELVERLAKAGGVNDIEPLWQDLEAAARHRLQRESAEAASAKVN